MPNQAQSPLDAGRRRTPMPVAAVAMPHACSEAHPLHVQTAAAGVRRLRDRYPRLKPWL